MTMSYDNWLQAPYYDDEDPNYDETISDRTYEYLSEGSLYDPFNWENFSNALCDATETQVYEIMDWAKNKNFEQLGRYIVLMVQDRMEKYAEQTAIEDYNKGLIGNDYDE